MKKFFLILIASLALVMTHDFNRAYAGDHDGDDGIPLSKLAGRYADTGQGSITICFKPDFTDTENCSTSGAVPVPFNAPLVGQFTQDKDGESCGTYTGTLGAPGGPGNLPIAHDHFVGKVTTVILIPGVATRVTPTTSEGSGSLPGGVRAGDAAHPGGLGPLSTGAQARGRPAATGVPGGAGGGRRTGRGPGGRG